MKEEGGLREQPSFFSCELKSCERPAPCFQPRAYDPDAAGRDVFDSLATVSMRRSKPCSIILTSAVLARSEVCRSVVSARGVLTSSNPRCCPMGLEREGMRLSPDMKLSVVAHPHECVPTVTCHGHRLGRRGYRMSHVRTSRDAVSPAAGSGPLGAGSFFSSPL